MPTLELADEPRIRRAIIGALKDTINAHGSINQNLMESAFKRIYGRLLNLTKENRQESRHPLPKNTDAAI
jgi:hypothetical protein